MIQTIAPHELPNALDRAPDGATILSLDCFDTLLWRECHAPADLFAGLPGLTPRQRAAAEGFARKAARGLHGRSEIDIAAIYDHALPGGDDTARKIALEAELTLEASTCFAFAPTVALMREAKARGLTVIIVSDTYLDAPNLHALIANAAGEEVAGLIDRVFASSEAGISKGQGLLADVVKAMKCRPDQILHIGDNRAADHDAARALGIAALHLDQFTPAARQRLRLERACQKLIGDPRDTVAGHQAHRALLARDEPQLHDPAEALGYTVLGPVFHAFDRWLREEAATLAQRRGGRVHWAFMLRDGHLPHIVHQAGGEVANTARVEISRFTAIASSLTSREAYDRQRALDHDLNPATLARQMLLDESEIGELIGDPQSDADRIAASERLTAELKTGRRQKLTIRAARARAQRLIAHVRATLDPQPGDTVMLVDLGYNGSAQDRIDALLSKELGVHVAGRYLLLREMTAGNLDKAGLFDGRRFDPDWLESMCENVAVLEQLATCELGSVIDYDDAGEPVRSQSAVKGKQSEVRDLVQEGVTRFARAAQEQPVIRCKPSANVSAWRDSAAGVLTRFLFLPHAHELAVLERFEHDVNLGSDRMVSLFDSAEAQAGLRRRGLFYMQGTSRMFLPAEIAGEDMATRLSLLAQKRFALPLAHGDTGAAPITIPAVYVGDEDSARTTIEAHATHEGFYVARLPVSAGAKGIGLQVGAVFDWFELGPITVSSIADLAGLAQSTDGPDTVPMQLDAIADHGDGLCECSDPAAFVLVTPPEVGQSEPARMIEIVLRPLRGRSAQTASADRPHQVVVPTVATRANPAA